MKDEIINRVAQSQLITFDLQEYYPQGDRVFFDISKWLHEGLVLKEYRERVRFPLLNDLSTPGGLV